MTSRQVQKLSSVLDLALGEPGHRALERMRMQVRHARQHVAPERFGASGLRHALHIKQAPGR